jgi:hypothetical protein
MLLLQFLLLPAIAAQSTPSFTLPPLPTSLPATKAACQTVYTTCMTTFRACLQSVNNLPDSSKESTRESCEDFRQNVCEDEIRVRCDQLPDDTMVSLHGDGDGDGVRS